MKAHIIAAACAALVFSCSTVFGQVEPSPSDAVDVPVAAAVANSDAPACCAPAPACCAGQPRLNNGIIDTPLEKRLFPSKACCRWSNPLAVRYRRTCR